MVSKVTGVAALFPNMIIQSMKLPFNGPTIVSESGWRNNKRVVMIRGNVFKGVIIKTNIFKGVLPPSYIVREKNHTY
jgi:hypothetical protein